MTDTVTIRNGIDVQDTSPVRDVLANATPVRTTLEVV